MKYLKYNFNRLNKEIVLKKEVSDFLTQIGLPLIPFEMKMEKEETDENGDLPFGYPEDKIKKIVSISHFYPFITENNIYEGILLELGSFKLNEDYRICLNVNSYNVVKYYLKTKETLMLNKDIFSFDFFLKKLSYLDQKIISIDDYNNILEELKIIDKETMANLSGYWGYNTLVCSVLFE